MNEQYQRRYTSSREQTRTIANAICDASVEAVVRHHFDLTTGEAAELAGVSPLQAVQSMRRLCDSGVIEPREPRKCAWADRPMAAYIMAPIACDQ